MGFTPQDMLAAARSRPQKPRPLPADQRWESGDGSEQVVTVHRAPLDAYADALDFWLAAADYRLSDLGGRPCRPIDAAAFERETGWTRAHGMRRPEGTFREAVVTSDDGLDLEVVCTTDREYYLFHWYTTA